MSIFNDGLLKATCYRNGAHQKLTRPLFASSVINNNVRRSAPAVFIDTKNQKITIRCLHENGDCV